MVTVTIHSLHSVIIHIHYSVIFIVIIHSRHFVIIWSQLHRSKVLNLLLVLIHFYLICYLRVSFHTFASMPRLILKIVSVEKIMLCFSFLTFLILLSIHCWLSIFVWQLNLFMLLVLWLTDAWMCIEKNDEVTHSLVKEWWFDKTFWCDDNIWSSLIWNIVECSTEVLREECWFLFLNIFESDRHLFSHGDELVKSQKSTLYECRSWLGIPKNGCSK